MSFPFPNALGRIKKGGKNKNKMNGEQQHSMAEEGFFVNKRNQRIFTRAWLPPALEKIKFVRFTPQPLNIHLIT